MSLGKVGKVTVQDRIERVVHLPVSRERAWRAITDPADIQRWFRCETTLDPRPGGELVFRWDNEIARGRVEAVEPPRRFAYWWHPGSEQHLDVPLDQLPLTLVEFVLEEDGGETRLTLTETGFASMPAEIYERVFRENSDGWTDELEKLAAYLGASVQVG
jgi:uncharacterized protein YndB with AHSA1/START domain